MRVVKRRKTKGRLNNFEGKRREFALGNPRPKIQTLIENRVRYPNRHWCCWLEERRRESEPRNGRASPLALTSAALDNKGVVPAQTVSARDAFHEESKKCSRGAHASQISHFPTIQINPGVVSLVEKAATRYEPTPSAEIYVRIQLSPVCNHGGHRLSMCSVVVADLARDPGSP
jgi:hypothetical protein